MNKKMFFRLQSTKVFAVIFLLSVIFSATAVFANEIIVEIDGVQVNFTDGQPAIVNGRTLVPEREVFEALNFTVGWDDSEQTATLTRDSEVIWITVDEYSFSYNFSSVGLDVPAQIIDGRVMLPLRDLLERAGIGVGWDAERKAVVISTETGPFIPSMGGELYVEGETDFSFTPRGAGIWEFFTSDNNGDPLLTLLDASGEIIARDDDGMGSLNSYIVIHLDSGEYTLNAGFFGSGTGSYTLTALEIPHQVINSSGDTVLVNDETIYLFIPAESGVWSIETSDRGNDDPYLMLFDDEFYFISYDDDGAGNLNSIIFEHLDEGQMYYIVATFFDSMEGSYTLTVSRDSRVFETIPSQGGETRVDEMTFFTFTPNDTGLWEFETSDNLGDPLLTVFEGRREIAWDDDSGNGLNSLIQVVLIEGREYTVTAGFWDNAEGGSYSLRIERVGGDTVLEPFVGTWRCGGDHGFCHWLCYLNVTESGRFTDADGDSGWFIASDNLVIFEFDFWDTIVIDYVLSENTLTFTAGHETVVLSRFSEEISTGEIPPEGGVIEINGTTNLTFTPGSTGIWEIFTSNNSGDPLLTVFNSHGSQVARNDDDGYTLNSYIMTHLQDNQEYRINAGFFGSGTGSYTLTVREVPMQTMNREGDSVSVVNETIFSFTPSQSGIWSIETSENGNDDPLLVLLNEDFFEIDWDDDSASGFNSRIVNFLRSSETYYIYATFYNSQTGTYTLTVSRGTGESDAIPGDGGDISVDTQSYLSFTPNESGIWVFETFNNSGDPLLTLFDSEGNQIARDDDGGSGLNSRIRISLTAGQEYLINAGFWNNTTGSYTLRISQNDGTSSTVDTLIDRFAGNWACDESESHTHTWLCVLRVYDDGNFIDGDGDTGFLFITETTVTFYFDDWNPITMDYEYSDDRLVLSSGSYTFVLLRQ